MLGRHTYLCHGGHEFDGREISPLDPDEIREVAKEIAGKGITAVAVSSVFSPVNTSMEQEAAAMLQEQVPGAQVTLSSDIGRVGLLERENAAILNACLRPLARETISAFRQSIADLGITAPLYITQNDGTLMSADFAEQYPVLTFASGPTNSMRGAAFLSGLKDAMVVDVGGTTSDVGALTHGFPREASVAVDIGGVRTNFRMPDVYSFGLGGGSLVREDPLRVGPQSVGYRITEEALVFGGETLTTTDIAVAAGVADIGDAERVTRDRPELVTGGDGTHPGDDRCRRRPDENQRRADPGDRRRRRQHPDRLAGCRRLGDGQTRPFRGGQRRRRGHRPNLGRSRPRLRAGRDVARRCGRGRQERKRRPRRSTPEPTRKPSRSSMSRTCRSPTCRATPPVSG